MKEPEFLSVSWEELRGFCFHLAKRITENKEKFDQIVAISRGGLVIGRILSDFLSLPISLFTIQAYKTIGKQKKPRITERLIIPIQNKKILLVDEIVDTGNTLSLALSHLKKLKPKIIRIAVIFNKQKSKITPEYFLFKTSAWVIFPYELRETIEELYHSWKENEPSLSNSEIRQRFQSLGFSKANIKEFWPVSL